MADSPVSFLWRRISASLPYLPGPLRRRLLQRMYDGFRNPVNPRALFIEQCRELEAPRVLELGARRSIPERSTLHKDMVPHAGEFLGCDLEPGLDVDVVADVHKLSQVTGAESFDVIISCSSFEHFKYPHLAAHEIMKTMRIGGLIFIQTHQSFPLHAYPADYFRFSREALAGLFGTQMGMDVLATDYEFPAEINTPRQRRMRIEPAFLNVRMLARKTAVTPPEFIYELSY